MQFILFADDTSFLGSGDNLKMLAESIQNEMVKLKKWFDINKLSVNWNKTKFMVFTNRKKDGNVSLSINGL